MSDKTEKTETAKADATETKTKLTAAEARKRSDSLSPKGGRGSTFIAQPDEAYANRGSTILTR